MMPGSGSVPSYWRYTVTPTVPMDRKLVKNALQADGITVDWPYDPPLHLQPVFQKLMGTQAGMLPRSEELLSRHICLPVHARLRHQDAEYVVQRLLYHGSRLAG